MDTKILVWIFGAFVVYMVLQKMYEATQADKAIKKLFKERQKNRKIIDADYEEKDNKDLSNDSTKLHIR